MKILKPLFGPFVRDRAVPGYLNIFLLLLLVFGIANFSIGLIQSMKNHGDLTTIIKHNEYTLYTPEIYKESQNIHEIRYPINSAIVMAPLFGFYLLDDEVIWFYLLLMVAAILSLPALLLSDVRARLDTECINYGKIIFIIILATAATRATLNVGQLGIILFALFLYSYHLAKEYPKLAAIVLAISISKPQMGLFFLIYMLVNGPLITSALAVSIHVMAHSLFCYLNGLNVFSTVAHWIKWQLQFSDHAISDNTGYVNSMHSVDVINFTRGLSMPDAVVFSAFALFFAMGLVLLYLNRKDRLAQLAILCIWPLFLFYHRPYDYFLIWGIVPLLLQNHDYKGGFAALKLFILGVALMPYLPTFGVLENYVYARQIFYVLYTGAMVLVFVSVTYISRRNQRMGYQLAPAGNPNLCNRVANPE